MAALMPSVSRTGQRIVVRNSGGVLSWWEALTHRCGVRGLLLLGALGAEVLPGAPREAGLALDGQRLAGAGRIAVSGLLAPARIVALQARAAAAFVPVKGGEVMEAAALLAEALALALPDDAAHLSQPPPHQANLCCLQCVGPMILAPG